MVDQLGGAKQEEHYWRQYIDMEAEPVDYSLLVEMAQAQDNFTGIEPEMG